MCVCTLSGDVMVCWLSQLVGVYAIAYSKGNGSQAFLDQRPLENLKSVCGPPIWAQSSQSMFILTINQSIVVQLGSTNIVDIVASKIVNYVFLTE